MELLFQATTWANIKGRIIAIDSSSGDPATLTIEANGEVIYKQTPVEDDYSDGHTYLSLPFRNQNRVPAQLFVQIYGKNGKICGPFTEASYFPVVPSFSAECSRSNP